MGLSRTRRTVLALAVASMALASCGKKQDGTPAPPAAEATPAPAAPAAAQATPAAPATAEATRDADAVAALEKMGAALRALDHFGLKDVGAAGDSQAGTGIPHELFMVFQLMFAIITPALITGAFAERAKFLPFCIFMVAWSLLVYAPDEPKRAAFYPFAEFSPEWQAIHFGLEHRVPVRFMDLPQSAQLGEEESEAKPDDEVDAAGVEADEVDEADQSSERTLRRDPLGHLAEAAGYSDGERWWDHLIESRQGDDAAIGRVIGPSVAQDEVPGVIERLIHTYLQRRDSEHERFIDTVRRIGLQPFKDAVYGSDHQEPAVDARHLEAA